MRAGRPEAIAQGESTARRVPSASLMMGSPGTAVEKAQFGFARHPWGRGVKASSYARSLATAVERAQMRLSVALVGVAEGKSTLLRRVEATMGKRSLKRVSKPLVIVAACSAQILTGASGWRLARAGFGRQVRSPALHLTLLSQKRVGSAYELRADVAEHARGRWRSHLS